MQQLSALPCSCCSLMRHSIVADSTPTISLRVDYDDHHVASCFQKTYFDVVFSSKRKSKSGFFHHFYCFSVLLTIRSEYSRCSGSMLAYAHLHLSQYHRLHSLICVQLHPLYEPYLWIILFSVYSYRMQHYGYLIALHLADKSANYNYPSSCRDRY